MEARLLPCLPCSLSFGWFDPSFLAPVRSKQHSAVSTQQFSRAKSLDWAAVSFHTVARLGMTCLFFDWLIAGV